MLDRRLGYFLAIVDQGSFRSASQVAGVTQPALSRAIRELEQEIGVELFQRLPKGIRLTTAGHIFEKRVRSLTLEERHARSELQAHRSGQRSILRVGAGLIWQCKFLPRALARLQSRHYGLSVQVSVGLTAGLHSQLVDGDLDFCLGAVDDLVLDPSQYVVERLAMHTLTAYVRAGHPLARRLPVQARDFVPWPWIIYTGDQKRVRGMNRRLQDEGLDPIRVAFEMNSVIMALNLTSQSDAVLCLSSAFLDEAKRNGLIPIPLGIGDFASGAWYRREKEGTAIVTQLLQYVRAEIEAEGLR